MIIYKATNLINGKVYIGQTIQKLKHRMSSHRKDSRIKKSYFYNAIKYNGWDNFKWEIIDRASDLEDLNYKESYWIEYFKSNNRRYGYNLTSGGGNYRLSQRSKNKISKANKGKKHTEETKLLMRAASKYKKIKRGKDILSMETRLLMSAKMKETNKKPEVIKNRSEAAKLSWEKYPGRVTGENNGRTKLKNKDVIYIKILIKEGKTNREISNITDIKYNIIRRIRIGDCWSHICI